MRLTTLLAPAALFATVLVPVAPAAIIVGELGTGLEVTDNFLYLDFETGDVTPNPTGAADGVFGFDMSERPFAGSNGDWRVVLLPVSELTPRFDYGDQIAVTGFVGMGGYLESNDSGAWQGDAEGSLSYVGFFDASHSGTAWALVDYQDDLNTLIVYSYGAGTAGENLLAGVPEPSTAGAAAGLSAGLAGFIRRRKR